MPCSPALGDLAGQARADGAIENCDLVGELAARFAGDGGAHVGADARQHALVEASLRGSTQYCGLRHQPRSWPAGRQIELALLRRLAGQNFQQFGVADEFGEAAHAQLRHDARHSSRHEAEVVHHHLGQADEVTWCAARCAAWPRRWRSC
jgi:hypothetical protein